MNDPKKLTVIAPSRLNVIQYRYHHGVNVGSCFVLEKWLTPSAFPNSTTNHDTSELAAVALTVKEIGLNATKQRFEERWSKFMTDADFDWLVNKAHCENIKIFISIVF
jgi:aryl-phospho-beta-D-glucosidase BglC (GH1 family)